MTDRGVDEDKRATLRRFAALGAAVPAAGVAGSAAASEGSDARGAIAGYVAATPGAHFSKVRDDLQLGTGETQHHLRELVGDGAIDRTEDGDYVRFYPAARFAAFEQRALAALRKETPRGMVLSLLREPGQSGAALASALDVSRPTISTHAGRLESDDIVEREDGYRVARPETVLALVVRYADSFDEDAVALADDANGLISYDP